MGGGIAGAFARAGIEVRLKDVSIEALRAGLAGAAGPLNRRVKRRKLKPRESYTRGRRIDHSLVMANRFCFPLPSPLL